MRYPFWRMALQINSNLAFSSALSSAPSTWYLFRKSDTCPHSDEGTTRKHPASVYNEETRQGKDEASARHCFIYDWILKNHWSEGRSDSQTDYGHIRLEACPGPNIYKHIFFTRQEDIQEIYAKQSTCQSRCFFLGLSNSIDSPPYCLLSHMFGSYAIKWLSCGFYVNLLSPPSKLSVFEIEA